MLDAPVLEQYASRLFCADRSSALPTMTITLKEYVCMPFLNASSNVTVLGITIATGGFGLSGIVDAVLRPEIVARLVAI
jgi:hypothetical protein